jgi:hypothetical protein
MARAAATNFMKDGIVYVMIRVKRSEYVNKRKRKGKGTLFTSLDAYHHIHNAVFHEVRCCGSRRGCPSGFRSDLPLVEATGLGEVKVNVGLGQTLVRGARYLHRVAITYTMPSFMKFVAAALAVAAPLASAQTYSDCNPEARGAATARAAATNFMKDGIVYVMIRVKRSEYVNKRNSQLFLPKVFHPLSFPLSSLVVIIFIFNRVPFPFLFREVNM